ncbi:hypothetical protein ACXR0O_25890 [Verrucomicrobiota bacterium sgz303538]
MISRKYWFLGVGSGMKLQQNQVWKQGNEYLRIVELERLEVGYKAVRNLLTGEGKHHRVSKKEFCRLIKGAMLLNQEQVREIWMQSAPAVTQDQSTKAE